MATIPGLRYRGRVNSIARLGLAALLFLVGACPEGVDPLDPSACQPRCASGYQCYRGSCRPVDAGNGPVSDGGSLDGDALIFDAAAVDEAGVEVWFKNTFSHLDTELISKEDGVNLSSKGVNLELKWGQYGANLLQNPGFESGSTTGWTDKGTAAAEITSAQKHAGAYAVGGGAAGHELYQDVDLTSLSAFVDRSRARAECGIWMYSSKTGAEADRGRFVASYHYAVSTSLDSYDTGQVQPSTWTQYVNERVLGSGIRRVRAWHQCALDQGSISDCYGDDAVVRIKLERYASSASVVYGRTFSSKVDWGLLSWSGILPPGTSIKCSARTSVSGLGGWGQWSRVATNTDDISSLPGVTDGHQAIEIKFELTSSGINSPTLTSFLLSY